jgi:alpha-N-arabinofuranosidase
VQTQNGEWWVVLLACRPYRGDHYNLGRETFLAPIVWKDGWPVVDGGRIAHSYPSPNLPRAAVEAGAEWKDDFDGDALGLDWNMIRNPEGVWHSLVERPGWLRLRMRPEELGGPGNPSFLGIRLTEHAFTASTRIDFDPADEHESAGIVIQQNNTAYYSLEVCRRDGLRTARLVKVSPGSEPEVRASVPVGDGPVAMTIEGRSDGMAFAVSAASGRLALGGAEDPTILSTKSASGFVGVYVGVYATSHGHSSANHADFDVFSYRGRRE